MTWKETLSYLYSALPMFQRIGPAAYKPNLDNTIALANLLGNPEKYFKTIHIAGTNGKGSTSHMLAAIFQEAGYKTGLYTSPHLKDFRERIRINGRMISKKAVIDFTLKHKQEFELLMPSFFEMTVGLAFDYFRRQKVDIAIIETGLGGRLDSTNIITPELSIITNISFDHTNLLGNTLGKIAFEKAGIIKPGIPVIIGETHKETKQVFLDRASAEGSPVYFADKILKTSNEKINRAGMLQLNVSKSGKILFEKMQLDLAGLYQAKNIKAVLLAAMMLKEKGFRLNEKIIRNALKEVTTSTGLKGRWQTISHHPLTICDTGHNEDGIRQVLKQINQLKPERLLMVFGMVNDKEVDKILKMLPRKARYFFCQASIPRAMDAMLLAEKAKAFHLNGIVVPDVKKALKTAQRHAGKNDLVFVGGSTFVVAEVC